jgi:hypothetical protein
VILLVADLEYNPQKFPKVISPILAKSGWAGYRQNKLANQFLTNLSNLLTSYCLTDMETFYKAFKRESTKPSIWWKTVLALNLR